jgi:hypothetical protein
MTKTLGWLAQAFLLVALVSWFGWLIARFTGPIAGVSYEGIFLFVVTSIGFVIAISLCSLALSRTTRE